MKRPSVVTWSVAVTALALLVAAVTPVQSTVGTVNCADTKRKVVVPKLAAYPAQLTD